MYSYKKSRLSCITMKEGFFPAFFTKKFKYFNYAVSQTPVIQPNTPTTTELTT